MLEFTASGSESVVLKVFMRRMTRCVSVMRLTLFGLPISGVIIFTIISKEILPSRVLAGSAKRCSTYINQSTILKGSLSA